MSRICRRSRPIGDGQMGCLMAAMDTPQAWSLFRPSALATAMTGLLVAAASMLMFASAALAHTPGQRDHGRPARHALPSPSGSVEAMAPSGCVPTTTTAIVFSVAASAADAGIPRGETEGIDFNHDCCGTACHAVGDAGRASAARRLPGSVVQLTGSPFLHSRSQGPPERPPRIA